MKKIGNAIYMHHTVLPYLDGIEKELIMQGMQYLPDYIWYKYTIVKVDAKNKKVSYIMCDDFDTAREPEVGDSYNVDLTSGACKIIKGKGQIYHHKWMFVRENYKGFDIEESKKWSETWRAIFPQDRKISSRIGYRKYWNEYLLQYGLEIEK